MPSAEPSSEASAVLRQAASSAIKAGAASKERSSAVRLGRLAEQPLETPRIAAKDTDLQVCLTSQPTSH